MKMYEKQEEDVLTYALFEQVATKFFEKRRAAEFGIDSLNCDAENKVHSI